MALRLVASLFISLLLCCRGAGTEVAQVEGSRAETVPVNGVMAVHTAAALSHEAASAATAATEIRSPAPKVLCDATYSKDRGPKISWPPPGLKATTRGDRVWINFWAAWCRPCVEELPRVRAFAEATHTPLVLISLDDDERQWRALIASLGLLSLPNGVQQIWLKPDEHRQKWLAQLKLADPPVLPGHAFLDHQRLRCYRSGSMDADDEAPLRAFLASLDHE